MTFYNSLVQFNTPSMVTATLGKNDPELGTRWTYGNAEYVFVYSSDAISVGLAACMTATAGGWTCSVGTVTGVDQPVGWCQHATLTTGTYGWLATRGIINVQMSVNVSAAIGALLTLGTNGFMISTQLSAATSVIQGPAYARALSNIASATSGYVYVR